jgi:hypothetical protein
MVEMRTAPEVIGDVPRKRTVSLKPKESTPCGSRLAARYA